MLAEVKARAEVEAEQELLAPIELPRASTEATATIGTTVAVRVGHPTPQEDEMIRKVRRFLWYKIRRYQTVRPQSIIC